MNEKMARLAERRERLIQLAAAQRTALAENIEPWRVPLARVDQGLAAVRAIRRNPTWLLSGVILIAALRPSRAMAWLRRGWIGWQLLKKVRT
jgi:hypothetical protein